VRPDAAQDVSEVFRHDDGLDVLVGKVLRLAPVEQKHIGDAGRHLVRLVILRQGVFVRPEWIRGADEQLRLHQRDRKDLHDLDLGALAVSPLPREVHLLDFRKNGVGNRTRLVSAQIENPALDRDGDQALQVDPRPGRGAVLDELSSEPLHHAPADPGDLQRQRLQWMAQHDQLSGIGRVVVRCNGHGLGRGLRHGVLDVATLQLTERMLGAERSFGRRGLDEVALVLSRSLRGTAPAEDRGGRDEGRQYGEYGCSSIHGYFGLEVSMGAQFVRPDMTQS